jgi:hypothetical protein
MRARVPSILVLAISAILLFDVGCEEPPKGLGDCGIACAVVDAGSGVPIDSARVFLTPVGLTPPHVGRRTFVGLTDKNGEFLIWPVGCDGLHIVGVEKESYVTATQVVDGAGDLDFALEKVAQIGLAPQIGLEPSRSVLAKCSNFARISADSTPPRIAAPREY